MRHGGGRASWKVVRIVRPSLTHQILSGGDSVATNCGTELEESLSGLKHDGIEVVECEKLDIPADHVALTWGGDIATGYEGCEDTWASIPPNPCQGGLDADEHVQQQRSLAHAHMRAWQKTVALDAPVLVFEDGVKLMTQTASRNSCNVPDVSSPTGLDHALREAAKKKAEVLYLCWSGHRAGTFRHHKNLPGRSNPLLRRAEYIITTRAYAIWPQGAKKLLAKASPMNQPVGHFMALECSERRLLAFVLLGEGDAEGAWSGGIVIREGALSDECSTSKRSIAAVASEKDEEITDSVKKFKTNENEEHTKLDSLQDVDANAHGLQDAGESSALVVPGASSEEQERIILAWRGSIGLSEVASICALCDGLLPQGLGPKASSFDISSGELLLALAGAHPKWVLETPVAATLRDLLRPLQCTVHEEWKLQSHQEDGYRWLMSRVASRLGGILADDMGLGKTRQAASWLLGIRARLLPAACEEPQSEPRGSSRSSQSSSSSSSPAPGAVTSGGGGVCEGRGCGASGCGRRACGPVRWERALVIAPGMLVKGDDSVWIRELREAATLWRVPLRVWQWHGERAQDLRSIACSGDWKGAILDLFDVVVTTYESFLANQEQFCQESWTCVILDEAQRIKNAGAKIASAVKRLAVAPFRLALTGTPIENSLEDIHSILQFIEPDCAGSLKDFWSRFPAHDEGRAALRRLLQSLALRREANDTIKMVAKEEVEVPVTLSSEQQDLYHSLREAPGVTSFKRFKDLELLCSHPWCYAAQAGGASHAAAISATEGPAASAAQAFRDMLGRLPERCLGKASEQRLADSAKMEELFRILRGLLARGDKVLIFFCRKVTGQLLQALVEREFGFSPGFVVGDTDLAERERSLRTFKAEKAPGVPSVQVLLLSVWVGAVGLNLPEARWVIHFERVWNPALERQATSRVHRITSTRPVKAYGLFTEGTVEERKRLVLSEKLQLSSRMVEALSGDLDGEEEHAAAEAGGEAAAAAALLADASSSRGCHGGIGAAAESGEADAGADVLPEEAQEEGDEDIVELMESVEGSDEGEDRNPHGPYPMLEELKPDTLRNPMVGKYGDPCNDEVWAWYADQGRREIHPKASERTTGHLLEVEQQKRGTRSLARFPSRPVRVHDPRERGDLQVSLDLGGTNVRLFIPERQCDYFEFEPGVRLRRPRLGEAAFPLLIPSSGRSALDPAVGLLDLASTMVSATGQPLGFVQIVAVKPSELENYRSSAPFFVVMELPRNKTCDHSAYGSLTPEDLGVGCARHWLLRLADALGAPHVFMLDDSVLAWRGVTLAGDSCSLFGRKPDNRAQFSNISLGRLLEHFADPKFLAEEMPKFSVLGFARFRPEMVAVRRAYLRSHVYAAFLINVHKCLSLQRLNFRQELYVWEDVAFNIQARDVCKCYRFAMIKKRFTSGGCTSQVARSATPYMQNVAPVKLSADVIAAQALGTQGHQDGRGRGRGRGKRKQGGDVNVPIAAPPDSGNSTSLVPVPLDATKRDALDIEADAEFTPEGAVCDASGMLANLYYSAFIQAFKEKEIALMDPAAPQGFARMPGLREGDEVPEGLRMWDDSHRLARRAREAAGPGGNQEKEYKRWGAGWIANPHAGGSSRWFNIRKWGSWRLAFVLARLQRAVWEAHGPAKPAIAALEAGPSSSASSSSTALVLYSSGDGDARSQLQGDRSVARRRATARGTRRVHTSLGKGPHREGTLRKASKAKPSKSATQAKKDGRSKKEKQHSKDKKNAKGKKGKKEEEKKRNSEAKVRRMESSRRSKREWTKDSQSAVAADINMTSESTGQPSRCSKDESVRSLSTAKIKLARVGAGGKQMRLDAQQATGQCERKDTVGCLPIPAESSEILEAEVVNAVQDSEEVEFID